MADKTILLTGANGFLGSHITDCLLRNGYNVRAMVRPTSNLQWLDNKPVELAYGALDEPDTLRSAVEGVDAVIHNAGVTSVENQYFYYHYNADATRNLLDILLEVNPKISRFVYVSSQAAGGPTIAPGPKKESDSTNPVSPYGHSKLLAEKHVLSVKDKLPVTIIRPPSIYGPRDTAFLPMFKMVARGWMPKIGNVEELTITHAMDVARQIRVQLENPAAIGEIFNAAPFEATNMDEFGGTIGKVLSVTPKVLTVPAAAIKYGLPAAHGVARMFGKGAFFNPNKRDELLQKRWHISGEKARDLLGFEGHFPLLAGVGQTVEWYRWKQWMQSPRDRIKEREGSSVKKRFMHDRDRDYDKTCDLCALTFDGEVKTHKHYEDNDFIIVDCMICRVPMAVLKEHRASFTEEEKQKLLKIFEELFGGAQHPDFEQRRIPEHAHVHYRNTPHAPPWQRRPE